MDIRKNTILKKAVFIFVMIASNLLNLSAQLLENDIIKKTDTLRIRSLSSLNDEYKINPPQVTPSSPQSQIFEQYLNHEITEYNGLPKIEIPLYEIKTKDITIPIILSYHASGIKYMQYDGDIAAGWSIGSTGYRITRQVKGASDFNTKYEIVTRNDFSNYVSLFANDRRKSDGFLLGLSTDPGNRNTPVTNIQPAVLDQVRYGDSQYDKFSYITPSSSGSFIIKDRVNGTTELMDEKQDIINVSKNECKITDILGVEYLFGGVGLIEKERVTEHETAWVLREIRTTSNESIRFNYKSYRVKENRAKELKADLVLSEAPCYHYYPLITYPIDYYFHEGERFSYYQNTNDQMFVYEDQLFLEEIETDNIIVRFKRESLMDISYMLRRIEVIDKLSEKTIEEIDFNSKVYPSNIAKYDVYHRTPSHFLLNSVAVSNRKYEMEYYTAPSNYIYAYPDQWNNYNFNAKYANSFQKFFLHKEFLEEKVYWAGRSSHEPINENFYNTPLRENVSTDLFADRSVDETNVKSFSLKKIKYPTGGYTEYVYEPNEVNDIKGGGLRIQKIISKSERNQVPLISEFRYSNGIANFNFDHNLFSNFSYNIKYTSLYDQFPNAPGPCWAIRMNRVRRYLMNPSEDFPISEYKIYYRNVDILQYDEQSNKYNGKKTLSFNIPSFPIIDYMEGVFLRYLSPDPDEYNRKRRISNSFEGEKPTIESISYFDNMDKLVKKEVYKYERTVSKTYEGIKATQNVTSSGGYMPVYPDRNIDDATSDYSYISSYVNWMNYKIETGTDLLSSKTETLYTPGGSLMTTEKYDYNDRYQIKKITRTNNTGNIIDIKDLRYPQDFASENNIYKQMVDKNMISPVIEKIYSTGDNQGIKGIKTEYNIFSNNYLPRLVKITSKGKERIELIYDCYDEKGNLLQYTTLDGKSTFYLWSYKHQYPVAEIKNATYAEVESALHKFGLTLYSHSATLAPGFDDNLLRKDLPNALITTYTYEPSVGITSITDPKGMKVTYVYDEFNKLKYIQDNESKRLSEYEYHYRTNY